MTHARFPDWSSLTPSERAEAATVCRARIAGIGPSLNAVARTFAGKPVGAGPLDGLPYVAKDMIATGQGPTSWGSRGSFDDGAPAAPVITHLESAGALLIAASEMTELAYEPSGQNTARGAVLNPWDRAFVTGGSSSGSAALVAAGACYAALGSDTGGSVRIPAHCCGVTALKPTKGRVPDEGTMPLAPGLDTIGLLTRSARDIALIWSALYGDRPAALTQKLVLLIDAFAASDSEIASGCRAALGVLAREGFTLSETPGMPDEADRHCLTVMQVEAARAHRERLDDARIDPVLRKRLAKGLTISEDEYQAALAARGGLRDRFLGTMLGEADAVALPVMPIRTPPVAEVDPAQPTFSARTLYAMSRFTRFVNYLGLPAVAVPAGFDSRGLPFALQLVGRPDSELVLLAIADRLQAKTDWHGRVPTCLADAAAA